MKRNVLQFIGSFHQGGSERQAVQLARLLHEAGRYQVYVACLDKSGVLLNEVSRLGVGYIPEYRLTSFYNRNALKQLRRFATFLRAREIDIVHTHDFYTNVFGMAAATLARVPVRIASRRETLGFRTENQKRVERSAYKLAHAIVANAEAVRTQLIDEGVRAEKIVTLYNGLDMKRVDTPQASERGSLLAAFNLPREDSIEKRRRFVVIVANLRHPVKDYPMFLRAARRVRAAVPEAAFVVAGEGELMTSMRALVAQLDLEKDVFFVGRCEKVAELLALSEVCVLSSKAEGFSNSILEYMAAARPVVVTDVGGAREAVTDGETGYLVPSGDDEQMAARIISLLREPERASAMGARGRRVIAQRFSCRAQLDGAQQLYDRLLTGGAARVASSIEQCVS